MNIISAQWANSNQTSVNVISDVGTSLVQADPTNPDYANLQDWVKEGNAISSYPVSPLTQAQAAAIAECIAYANSITAKVTAQYPQVEVDSWPTQLIEARMIIAGQTPPTPSLLQDQVTVANNPSVTLQTRAEAVIANATLYQQIVGAVQFMRVAAQTQINATTDASQIPAVLAALETQADATAKQYGLIT